MTDEPVKTDIPAFEPATAEIEQRAAALARADGLTWAATGTPEQSAEGQHGSATHEDRERYRKLAQERLEAERGLIIP